MLLPENASTWLDDVKPEAIKESTFSFARARRGLRRFVIKQRRNMNRYSGSLHSYHMDAIISAKVYYENDTRG